jgi:hypothetical protein
MCKKCVNTLLPFSSIDNSEFNFIFGNYNRIPNDNDIERLSELKFNPFDENISTNSDAINTNMTSLNLDNINCDYFFPNDVTTNIANNKFSILHLNIRSISNKFDSFKHLLNTLKQSFSVIGLSETWLNDQNCENFMLDDYTFVSKNRNHKNGGGVGMYTFPINLILKCDLI